MSQRKRYSKDFKLKIIQLKESGVPRKQLLKDYDLKAQTFNIFIDFFINLLMIDMFLFK